MIPGSPQSSLPEHDALRAGRRLPPLGIPDHTVLQLIGRGSYGEVWLARNVIGTLRAVKIVYRQAFDHDRPYEREFMGIQRFEPLSRTHEGLVDILQVGRNDPGGYFYYVMEVADDADRKRGKAGEGAGGNCVLSPSLPFSATQYCPRTLAHEVSTRGALPVDECISLALSLASAVAHLHKQGLIHRDIKPANIIFVGGAPKLADIGLVSEVGDSRSYVGTEGYIPPEGPGTRQADLYSLGKLIYEASTGRDRTAFPALPVELTRGESGGRFLELLVPLCAFAQPFDLSWFTIDGGGGGTSTGDVYSVSSTIGQPDAGLLNGGNFTLQGGFWGAVAVIQTPGAPRLSVERISGAVRVFWPMPAAGFGLEETTSLVSPPAVVFWSAVGFPYQTNATHISITVPMPAGNKYYRLRKP